MFMVLKRFFLIRAIQSISNHDLTTSRKYFLRGIVMQYKNQIFYLETYFSSQKFIISTILRWNDFFQIVWKFFLQELWIWFLLQNVSSYLYFISAKNGGHPTSTKKYIPKKRTPPQMGVWGGVLQAKPIINQFWRSVKPRNTLLLSFDVYFHNFFH